MKPFISFQDVHLIYTIFNKLHKSYPFVPPHAFVMCILKLHCMYIAEYSSDTCHKELTSIDCCWLQVITEIC